MGRSKAGYELFWIYPAMLSIISNTFHPPHKMTRSELIARLANRFRQLTASNADLAVKTILDAMGDRLAEGGRIEIRGFGSFSLNKRPPRRGRNPKTGEPVMVPEKYVPHFKAGKEMREAVMPAE